MSVSLRPHGLYSPWNSPGQNTGVGNLFLLQGIFPNQELNLDLLHCRQILYQLSYKGSPIASIHKYNYSCLVAHMIKNLPAMQETQVWSLGWKDPLEKEMAIFHSSILACRIPWTEEPGGLQSMGSQRIRHDRATNTHSHTLNSEWGNVFLVFNLMLFFNRVTWKLGSSV